MAAAPEGPQLSAEDALARLIEGNRRFLRGEARSSAFRRETLIDLAKAQTPYATVIPPCPRAGAPARCQWYSSESRDSGPPRSGSQPFSRTLLLAS